MHLSKSMIGDRSERLQIGIPFRNSAQRPCYGLTRMRGTPASLSCFSIAGTVLVSSLSSAADCFSKSFCKSSSSSRCVTVGANGDPLICPNNCPMDRLIRAISVFTVSDSLAADATASFAAAGASTLCAKALSCVSNESARVFAGSV